MDTPSLPGVLPSISPPAALKKEGAGFDLPIALGILAALEFLPADKLENYIIVGELSLDGRVKPVRGCLSLALTARDSGFKGVILPDANAAEAAVVEDIEVIGVSNLLTTTGFLMGRVPIEPTRPATVDQTDEGDVYPIDFREIRGQEYAKRAIEVAAAGAHNVLALCP